MELNKLRDEAYQIAKEHGWHDKEYSDSHWLMLLITEIAEAVQAHRKGDYADDRSFELQTLQGEDFKTSFELHIKNSVEDELSDIIIRILDLTGLKGIDLDYSYELIKRGMNKIDKTFPEFMYECCADISNASLATLTRRLNVIVAAIICYCEQKYIDIEWFIEQKMKYNRLRPYMHGDKRY